MTPYVVALQNSRFDRAQTCFVAALVKRDLAPGMAHYLAPHFLVLGEDVVLDVFNLATLPTSRLGAPVTSLADEGSRVKLVRAMDEFLSQA